MRIIDEMDRALVLADREETWTRKSHYASDAEGCARAAVYGWLRTPQSDPDDATSLIKMRMGDAAELLVRDALQRLVAEGQIASFAEQVSMPDPVAIQGLRYPLGMRTDFVVYHLDQTKEGIEVKSSFGKGIVNIQRTGRPKPEHIAQVFMYLHHFAPRYRLVYIGRDSGYRTEFGLELVEGALLLDGEPLDPAVYDMRRYVEKFRGIEAAAQSGELPARPYLAAIKEGELRRFGFVHRGVQYKGDWQCHWCRYRSLCWGPELEGYSGTGAHNAEMFSGRVIGEEDEG